MVGAPGSSCVVYPKSCVQTKLGRPGSNERQNDVTVEVYSCKVDFKVAYLAVIFVLFCQTKLGRPGSNE